MFPHLHRLLLSRRFKRFNQLSVASAGLALSIALTSTAAHSQSIRNARIIEIVDTPDTQKVLINQSRARTGDQASLGQRVLTTQAARTGLLLTGSAGVRLGRNSAFTVGSECIRLESGKALIFSTRGCIGSVIANNRGTIYVLERTGQQGTIKVLQGSVVVSNLKNRNIRLTVNQGQKVSVRATGELGRIAPISSAEFESILNGELFDGFDVPLAHEDLLAAVLQQLSSNQTAASNQSPQPTFEEPPYNPNQFEPSYQEPPVEQPPTFPNVPPIQQPRQPTRQTPPVIDQGDLQRDISQEIDRTRIEIEQGNNRDSSGDNTPTRQPDRPSVQVIPRFNLQFPQTGPSRQTQDSIPQ
jgi:hypothetical protein